jgi:hypothetical protein
VHFRNPLICLRQTGDWKRRLVNHWHITIIGINEGNQYPCGVLASPPHARFWPVFICGDFLPVSPEAEAHEELTILPRNSTVLSLVRIWILFHSLFASWYPQSPIGTSENVCIIDGWRAATVRGRGR